MSLKSLILALAASATVSSLAIESPSIEDRDDPCDPCAPAGAQIAPPPAVGPGLAPLYLDVLQSVQGIHYKRSLEGDAHDLGSLNLYNRASGFCCQRSLKCINVQNLNIAACYNQFGVNFAFADGSYGSLVTGDYVSGSATANLFTGNYTNGNEQGNIYASATQDKPNTATLSIPPQFTGTGVGGAIPASALGSYITFTTVIPGTTYTAPTTVPQTVKVATASGGQVVSVTIPAQTITGATTLAPQTTTVTQAQPGTTSGAASSSSKHAAAPASVDSTRSYFMSIVCSLAYFLYAL